MIALTAILQFWPVFFSEHVFPHPNHIVRSNADDSAIEGGMVNLAQSQAIGNFRNSLGVGSRNDMCGNGYRLSSE